jgi:hypothetical protein
MGRSIKKIYLRYNGEYTDEIFGVLRDIKRGRRSVKIILVRDGIEKKLSDEEFLLYCILGYDAMKGYEVVDEGLTERELYGEEREQADRYNDTIDRGVDV